jgi:Flp pilus assembly protein TadD
MRGLMAGAVAVVLASGLGACASLGGGEESAETGREDVAAARTAIGREDMLTQMAFWAADYAAHPEDIEAARGFAEALRQGGRNGRAVEVSIEALRRHGDDPALWRTLGLSYLASGRPHEALQPLALLTRAEPDNVDSRSALGVALDQLERFDEARMAYQEALAIRPDDPRVLTNLGVSFLLTGDAEEAEAVLRQAAALSGAPPEARQNLAIALGLQGRLEEAEAIARVDLPPAMAAANVSYLRGLFEDPRRWNDLDSALRR